MQKGQDADYPSFTIHFGDGSRDGVGYRTDYKGGKECMYIHFSTFPFEILYITRNKILTYTN